MSGGPWHEPIIPRSPILPAREPEPAPSVGPPPWLLAIAAALGFAAGLVTGYGLYLRECLH